MSKGLEALDFIKKDHFVGGRLPLIDRVRFETIEKELKALEIIKECKIIYAEYGNYNYIQVPKNKMELLKEILS